MAASTLILQGFAFLGFVGAAMGQTTPLPPAPPGVQVTTEYGMEFVNIAAGQQTAQLGPNDPEYSNYYTRPEGLGGVVAPFRMARTELTTASWLGFVNTFADRDAPAWFNQYGFSLTVSGPLSWGARPALLGDGRQGWAAIQGFESSPVDGIPLAEAALYCNWLHNGQSSDFNALLGGAYQLPQFQPPTGLFTSPITRETGARFWIPSLDEWTRAAHFNPATGTFTPWATGEAQPFPGPPGFGNANAGFEHYLLFDGTPVDASLLPVASYPDVQSPLGLFDVAGGVQEWTDTVLFGAPSRNGMIAIEGSYAGFDWPAGAFDPADMAFYSSFTLAHVRGGGLRIAAAIPTPAALGLLSLTILIVPIRRSNR